MGSLNETIHKKLVALLADDRLTGDRLIPQIAELRERENVPAFALAVRVLAQLELSEPEAQELLGELMRHREDLAASLGRDPGVRVAAVDYLTNVRHLLAQPTIVERSRLEAVEKSAMTDSLTGLYNRRHFIRALDLEVRRSQRYDLTLSLLLLDLDAFKRLNDEHGHLFGDLVLQRVGQVLRRTVRDPDVACRFGGDEFAVILPETDRLGCFAVGERIRQQMRDTFARRPIDERTIETGVSGGIATFPDDGGDSETLVGRADQALYVSKSRGKDRISLYFGERRRFVRYPARARTRAVLRLEAGDATAVPPLNISRGGVLAEVAVACVLGRPVEMTFGGKDDEGRPRSWVAAGQTVRIEPSPEPGGRERVAVAFERPLPDACLRRQARGLRNIAHLESAE